MKISLVTSTLNRPVQIGELLTSLEAQSRRADQIIIVDQSDDDATAKIVADFSSQLPITYIKDDRRGLSKGRNLGLKQLAGDIVAFPDDDCVYPTDTIAHVLAAFEADPDISIYTGMSVTPAGIPSQGRWGTSSHALTRYNIWISQTSYTTFYRSKALEPLEGFNEQLGVGAGTIWGAGEETELMLRVLASGAMGRYDPVLKIAHPEPLAVYDAAALDRGKRYNRGFGRVMRMAGYPIWFVVYMAGRPLLGAAAALARGRISQALYRFIAFRERIFGWADHLPSPQRLP